jgi:hypothetical protein
VRIVVGFGITEEDTELTVQTTLNALAVISEYSRLLLEISSLLLRVDMLLKALDG